MVESIAIVVEPIVVETTSGGTYSGGNRKQLVVESLVEEPIVVETTSGGNNH